MRDVAFPEWFAPFYGEGIFRCLYGGRSAGKTWALAHWLILEATRRQIRVACTREFQKSLDDSVKPILRDTIERLGLQAYFNVGVSRITMPATDSVFFFAGLERNPENVRGWEGVTHVWVEEAHQLSRESARILLPTVMRGANRPQIWFLWNPKRRSDWVWRRFCVNPQPGDIIRKVGWRDNPFLPAMTIEYINSLKETDPEVYLQDYGGEPRDGDASTTLLPHSYLEPCMEAWRQRLHETVKGSLGPKDAGQDVADGGTDKNAAVRRHGPLVTAAESWPSSTPGDLSPTAKRAHEAFLQHIGIRHGSTIAPSRGIIPRLYYDRGGVGSPIRKEFFRLSDPLPYGLQGVNFGAAPAGPDVAWTVNPPQTNAETFSKRNVQLAWAIRMRALRTGRLLNGDKLDPRDCLFIPDNLPGLEELVAQLCQPQWRDNPTSGKYEIDKRGEESEKSPDLFDAACLAFARDSENGLTLL